jgi:hypothetical protein
MISTRNPGNVAGFRYLLLSVIGPLEAFTYLMPALSGELAIMLWLVIKGDKPPAPAAATG